MAVDNNLIGVLREAHLKIEWYKELSVITGSEVTVIVHCLKVSKLVVLLVNQKSFHLLVLMSAILYAYLT